MSTYSTQDFWNTFSDFCGDREPCDELALEFIGHIYGEPQDQTREVRASILLCVLQTQLAQRSHAMPGNMTRH